MQEIEQETRKEQRKKIVEEFQRTPADSASAEVQIALITHRLGYLNEHFKLHKKDHHSRRGLMKLVGRRRKLLAYFNRKKPGEYQALISKLNIRK